MIALTKLFAQLPVVTDIEIEFIDPCKINYEVKTFPCALILVRPAVPRKQESKT